MAKPLDIRLDLGFFRNRKTRRLLRELGPDGVLALLRIWMYAAEFHQSGVMSGLDDDDWDDIAEWSCAPDAERIRPALRRLGWVENDGKTLHDWEKHQGWIVGAEARSEAARKAAQAKHSKRLMRGASGKRAGRKRNAKKRICPVSYSDPDPDPNGREGEEAPGTGLGWASGEGPPCPPGFNADQWKRRCEGKPPKGIRGGWDGFDRDQARAAQTSVQQFRRDNGLDPDSGHVIGYWQPEVQS